jgi:hypothetical protein
MLVSHFGFQGKIYVSIMCLILCAVRISHKYLICFSYLCLMVILGVLPTIGWYYYRSYVKWMDMMIVALLFHSIVSFSIRDWKTPTNFLCPFYLQEVQDLRFPLINYCKFITKFLILFVKPCDYWSHEFSWHPHSLKGYT